MNENLPNAEALCRVEDPHLWTDAKNALMVAACRELALFHARRSPELRALYARRGFDPETVQGLDDLSRIPPVGVTAMKHHLLTSLPPERAVLKLTSSGTRGQKTQIWFDQASLDRAQSMLTVQWRQEGLSSDVAANYLMFAYDPEDAKDLGIAFTNRNQQRFAPVARSWYAVRKNPSGAWEFRKDLAVAQLEQMAAEGRPVRLFGIPSFVYEFLLELKRPVRLHPDSLLVTGGGWKAAEDKKVSREYFRAQAVELLGLPPHRVRDAYGMAEHSAPYIECREHRFHVPVFNRVLARDPRTLEVLPVNQVGLLELISPYNTMMPNLALLSTDLGYLSDQSCPCGHNAPTFILVGRGGLTKHKGCAIHASDIVRR